MRTQKFERAVCAKLATCLDFLQIEFPVEIVLSPGRKTKNDYEKHFVHLFLYSPPHKKSMNSQAFLSLKRFSQNFLEFMHS